MKIIFKKSYLKSTRPICQNVKLWSKTKIFKFETKDALYEHLWATISEAIVIFENNTLSLVKLYSFVLILGPKMSYLNVFSLGFQKTIVIFEIRILEFVKNQFVSNKVN